MKIMEIKNIIRPLSLCICMVLMVGFTYAQTDTIVNVVDKDGMLPLRRPWNSSMIIDNQTTEGPSAKQFHFSIHHRFGKIKEMGDIFGIYASSNIRLGLNYGITEDISIGFGTEKYKKMQEFQGKYKIISQTRNGKIPVSVSYFGNIVIDGRDKEIYGVNYNFKNRLSFFNQVIVSRKFTDELSVQLAGSFSHFNAVTDLVQNSQVDTIGKWKNDYIGAMFGARYRFHKNISAIAEYCQPFGLKKAWDGQSKPLPNIGLGVEFGTSTHAFQVFAANYEGIIAQENYSHNTNDLAFEGWRFGFNITVRF
ncbi:MAG: hypothetical protein JXR51_04545 [Bacteroidales bacterium]|nr:hypothetical protein [Bacteroidales bacterium]MBN2756426.1 hypothetical protein [Bacteroidales bacterium]